MPPAPDADESGPSGAVESEGDDSGYETPAEARAPDEAEPNLEDLLLRMKNTSELMVDLAYSAVLYESREIAEEVLDLEDEMDGMHALVQRTALEAHRWGEITTDRAVAYTRLAEAAEVIADSAAEIADVVVREVEMHPIITESIRESDVTIARVEVQPESALDGATLGGMHVATETGMKIIALRRGRKYTYGPRKGTEVHAGDVLFARGPPEGEDSLREMAGLVAEEEDE